MSRRDRHPEDGPVRLVLDPSKPLPELTPEQRARLDALAAMPDEEIDYSDVPPLTEDQLARMRRGSELRVERRAARETGREMGREMGREVTVRLDRDVLDWLRAGGPDYAARLNAILRRAMREEG